MPSVRYCRNISEWWPNRRIIDPHVESWALTVVANGGIEPSYARKVTLTTLVRQLKRDGIWSSLDRLWLFAAENSQSALIDIKSKAIAIAVNSPTFTVNRGFATNGTTSYVRSDIFSDGGASFLRDSASEGGWIDSAPTTTGGIDFGHDYDAYSMIQTRYGADIVRWEINSGSNPSGTPVVVGSRVGFWHSQRTGATTSRLLKDGVEIVTSSGASVALSSTKYWAVGAYVNTIGSFNFSAARYGAMFVANSLAGKEVAFYNAIFAYMLTVLGGFDADVTAWANQVVTNGGTVSDIRKLIVSDFVKSEKASGAWDLTDDYWMLWGENAIQALTSLKQRRLAVAFNSPTFTANRGYAFNGATNYIDLGFVPSTHGVAMTGTSLRFGVYERTNLAQSTFAMGSYTTVDSQLRLIPRTAGNRTEVSINSGYTETGNDILDSRGLTIGQRSVDTYKVYKNGISDDVSAPASSGISLSTKSTAIGAYMSSAAAGFRSCSVGCAVVGGALSAAQELAQYNNIQTIAINVGAFV